MTPEQAHQLLTQLASVYKGTLQEHVNLQEALKTLTPITTTEGAEKKDAKK